MLDVSDYPLAFFIVGEVDVPPLLVDGGTARTLLDVLPLCSTAFGCIEARELAARCRRRLWPEFRERAERDTIVALLALAESARDGDVLYC